MIQRFLDSNIKKHQEIIAMMDDIMKPFDKYQPTVVGTYPIGIETVSSDIDIVLQIDDKKTYIKELMQLDYLHNFSIKEKDQVICRFTFKNYEFELYASNLPVEQTNSYRHLAIEKRVLDLFGQEFRREIIELKKKGIKTEPAFCLLLNLYGNSYDALLKLESMTDQDIVGITWSNSLKALKLYEQLSFSYFEKGWSRDIKLIAQVGEKKYLVRQSDSKYTSKRNILKRMDQLSLKINVSKPVDYYENHANVEMFEWLEGVDLESTLTHLSPYRQYELGQLAGVYQKHIHEIHGKHYDWYDHYSQKIDRIIDWYLTCGISMPDDQQVIDFIEKNKYVLKNRPIVFQHGDYHIGNMLYTPDGGIGIIDFNRASEGDPWEEYDRFIFTYGVSPYFALGQLRGYLDDITMEFFKVTAVYAALNSLAGIPWAIPFGQKDVDVMKKNYMNIFETYQGFESIIPKWYSECLEEESKWALKV